MGKLLLLCGVVLSSVLLLSSCSFVDSFRDHTDECQQAESVIADALNTGLAWDAELQKKATKSIWCDTSEGPPALATLKLSRTDVPGFISQIKAHGWVERTPVQGESNDAYYRFTTGGKTLLSLSVEGGASKNSQVDFWLGDDAPY